MVGSTVANAASVGVVLKPCATGSSQRRHSGLRVSCGMWLAVEIIGRVRWEPDSATFQLGLMTDAERTWILRRGRWIPGHLYR